MKGNLNKFEINRNELVGIQRGMCEQIRIECALNKKPIKLFYTFVSYGDLEIPEDLRGLHTIIVKKT